MPDETPPGPDSPQRVGVRELRNNLTTYLRQARQGSAFLVTAHDEVIAELRPPSPALRPARRPGRLRDRIRMASDFDTLPPDILDAIGAEP
jgi:antitoxin (DNA-binding transcriptional repressor) of toxin-antitoxin stability system